MSVYALDSNIVSFYLRGNHAVIENIEKAIGDDHSIIITPITYYEVKRGLLLIDATKQITDNTKHFKNIKGLHTVNWR